MNDRGASTDEGTVEEWWAGPKLHRTVYTGPKYSSTELTVESSEYFEGDLATIPSPLDLLTEQVVHPGPTEEERAGAQLAMLPEAFGKVTLDCVMVGQPIKGMDHAPIGLFPTYCLQVGSPMLRATYSFGSLFFVRNSVGQFQGRTVPITLNASVDGKEVLRARVELLQGFTPAAGDFEPASTMTKIASGVAKVSSGVMAGSITHNVPLYYPQRARQRHISGRVVLRGIIGSDGRIRSLQVTSTPDGDLAIAALAAIRQWRYKPFLLNGAPTAVETTITANFNIGG